MKINLLDAIEQIALIHQIPLRRVKEPFDGLENFDFGLRRALNPEFDFKKLGRILIDTIIPPTLLAVEDFNLYRYALFALPEYTGQVFLLGPWSRGELPEKKKWEFRQRFGSVSAQVIIQQHRELRVYQKGEPVLTVAALIRLAYPGSLEEMVPIEDYEPFRINLQEVEPPALKVLKDWSANTVENCSQAQSRFMFAASRGDADKTLSGIQEMRRFDLGRWTNNPLRNVQNILHMYNALLKVAVECGGVHPYYAHTIYNRYGKGIENLEREDRQNILVAGMVQDYCACVREYSLVHYSPQIRKVVNQIHLNLAEPLSLKGLAQLCNISPSYLSGLFKKETGQTLIDYINERRIRIAAEQLIWGKEPVSEIAAQVGILDVNYFARRFKKVYGMTPSAYRDHYRKQNSCMFGENGGNISL